MAYPPTVPPNSRANGTATFDDHPSDHNALADALTDLINELGSGPKGGSTDLTVRLAALVPPGVIQAYGGGAAPAQYLLCNGAAVSQATYAALYAVIGVTYGDPGGGNFNLPNLVGRAPFGRDAGVAAFATLGGTGGSRDAILVSHSHPVTGTTNLAHGHADTFATDTTGSGHGHTVTDSRSVWTQRGTGAQNGFTATPAAAAASGFDATPLLGTDGTHTHGVTGSVTALPTTNQALASGLATPSTTPAGASAIDGRLPPYQVVNYIIKT
jgi:microcystin-dependent protein